ncbi:MAG: asparagine synthetase B family protein, partial [Rickettsiales bacterium]
LFHGIRRVQPGEVLRIKRGRVEERITVPLELSRPTVDNEEQALEQFDALFEAKIRTHLQSEVPYGAFLSGGIDSSSVVTEMAEVTKNLQTYTIGFEHISVADERSTAENLAHKLGARHTSVEFGEEDFWRYLPQMCRAMDDLIADYAALPTLKLARCAQSDVKIILSGEGGDEILAGYGRYRRQSLLSKLLGRPFRGRGDAARFAHLFQQPEHFAQFYKREQPDRAYHQPGFTSLQDYQARDIAEWLPNDLLLKIDRCLMHYSIEGRVPLLDREMVRFAFSLADKLKIQGKKGKWLLKKWLHARHPELDVWAPKRGFTVPIQEWLEKKREHLAPWLCSHPALQTIIAKEAFAKWLEKPLGAKDAKLLFNFLCLAVWYDIHIEGLSGEWEW